jgi:very-short-patch-repair endonuclease
MRQSRILVARARSMRHDDTRAEKHAWVLLWGGALSRPKGGRGWREAPGEGTKRAFPSFV